MIDTVANLLMIGIRSILIIPFVPFVLERIANERHETQPLLIILIY